MSLADRIGKAAVDGQMTSRRTGFDVSETAGQKDQYADMRKLLQDDLISQVNNLSAEESADANFEAMIDEAINRHALPIPRRDRARVISDVIAEVSGLGPLQPLMSDSSITEIMVNGPKDVFVERRGKIVRADVEFEDQAHVQKIIERIVAPLGRRCDEASPMVDARLSDGSRVNAVISPVALRGPYITIRRFSATPLQVADLVRFGSMSYAMASFLEAAVKGKANIIVSGGTGSGKTTLLNVLSGYVPEDERIVTIEDAAELKLTQTHVVPMEARPANAEGAGRISIRDLVVNALRMRPDRIIVGEVRSGEALDMLQAMNTGHEGSLTTAHANAPRDALTRIETMCLMSGMELPLSAIRVQIASAIDIIVQQSRFRDGSRKITSISEVVGMEGDVITLQDIFVFKNDGMSAGGKIRGTFAPTGIRPKIVEKLRDNGANINDNWFSE